MLFCQNCPKSCGTFVESNTVSLLACEAFGNHNGKLVCDLPPNEDNLPHGTYRDSCGGCRLTQTKQDGDDTVQSLLSCSHCQSHGGETESSEMVVGDCKIIGNNHGQLVCESTDIPARQLAELDGLPEGPYLDSCTRCRYDFVQEGEEREDGKGPYHVLQCSCKTIRSAMKVSKLVLRDPCTTQILNKNGKLYCPVEPLNRRRVDQDGKIGYRVGIQSNDGSLNSETFKQVPLAEGWSVNEDGSVTPPIRDEL